MDMGTRLGDSPASYDSDDENYQLSFLFNNEIDESASQNDVTPQSSPEKHPQEKSPLHTILQTKIEDPIDKEEIEKYKDIAYSQITKTEKLERKCKDLERMSTELEQILERTTKQRDDAIREKENVVMKYAVGEKKILAEIRLKEKAEQKCKDLNREREILQHKVQMIISEKARICQMFDNKVHEQKNLQQEFDRLKTEHLSQENDLKRCQNNLKNEIEVHRESQTTIENLNKKIIEANDQIQQAKKDAQEAIKAFKYSEENQAYVLEQKCKEQQASLILLKHERDDRESQVKNLQSTLERLQLKHREIVQENISLSHRAEELEHENFVSQKTLNELREHTDKRQKEAVDLQIKTAQLEEYKLQITNLQEKLTTCQEKLNTLESKNIDQESVMNACRARESELLSFTQQLTDKNVKLQAEFTSLETKVHQLTSEHSLIRKSSKEHETRTSILLDQLSEEKQRHIEEIRSLKKNLNEQIQQNHRMKQELADQIGENSIIKRKYELSLKEVQKELQQCRKNLEVNMNTDRSTSSSSSSLNGGNAEKNRESYTDDSVKVIRPDTEIQRQTLIEHIVKLQRISARKSEKIDFLEEHVSTLIAELQKKSKLLQIYMLREQTGTLTSDKMDNTKADLAKLNGVMASMYSSRVADEHLTLELSLDINRKLQAVLEDALLKNITLKKNVDTLGQEIDRLTKLLNCKIPL